MSNIIRNTGRTLADYLTGLPTRKEMIFEESEAREFWPSYLEFSNGRIFDKQEEIKKYRQTTNSVVFLQITGSLIAGFEFLNPFSEETNRLSPSLICALSLKLFTYALGRGAIYCARKLNSLSKEAWRESQEKNTEGEEWKEGTNYPLSDEYL